MNSFKALYYQKHLPRQSTGGNVKVKGRIAHTASQWQWTDGDGCAVAAIDGTQQLSSTLLQSTFRLPGKIGDPTSKTAQLDHLQIELEFQEEVVSQMYQTPNSCDCCDSVV